MSGNVQDKTILITVSLSLLLVAFAIFSFSLESKTLRMFLHFPSILLVFGGTLAVTLIAFDVKKIRECFDVVVETFSIPHDGIVERINYFTELCRKTRNDGNLYLEREASKVEDSFLRYCLEVAVDCHPEESYEDKVNPSLTRRIERWERALIVLSTMNTAAPAAGFIGTLIGLLQLFDALDKSGNITTSMSLALVATLYGTVFSHLIVTPLIYRVKARLNLDKILCQLSIEALSSIVKNENPIVLEQRLEAYMELK